MCDPGQVPGGPDLYRPQGSEGPVTSASPASSQGDPHVRAGQEHPDLYWDAHGSRGTLEEGRYRPNRGLTLQVDQQPPECDQKQGPHERGLRPEERLGHRGALGPEGQPAVKETDPTQAREEDSSLEATTRTRPEGGRGRAD